ncbi:DUF2070 family protein [Candidatus Micrarchaeota archaeon]|nr:DUF2070 family protein [Candidatus Micrarchaeota archaeon]
MNIDQREKAVEVTNYFFKIPPYKTSISILIILSFAYGLLTRLLIKANNAGDALLYGGAEGFVLIGLPAIFSATLAASLYRKQFKKAFKHYAFIALTSAIILTLVYSVALFFLTLNKSFIEILLIGNALVVLLWFAVCFLVLNNGKKSLLIAFLQPLFGISFLWLWSKFGLFEASLSVGSPVTAVFKLAISSVILLLSLWLFFFIVNAPAKRNFGISTIQTTALFFASWIQGTNALEKVLQDMGEELKTFVGGIVFKTKNKTTLFIIPGIHFGPFGNIAGSETPAIIQDYFNERKIQTFTFHSTVNHDWNPVHSSEVNKLIPAIEKNLKKKGSSKGAFFTSTEGKVKLFGLSIEKTAIATLTRAPESTEDIDYSIGLALKNKLLTKGWSDALLIDRHNSITDGYIFEVGSKEFYEYEGAVSKVIKPKKHEKLAFGIAVSESRELDAFKGIARTGIRVAVIKTGVKTACVILIDGNNIIPEFRNKVVEKFHKKFDFIDVFSTDSHAVNTISGIHNPIGKNNPDEVINEIERLIPLAVEDVEPCEASFFNELIELNVLGANRQSELQSTINSIVAIAKIIAPAILIISILLVGFSLLLLR